MFEFIKNLTVCVCQVVVLAVLVVVYTLPSAVIVAVLAGVSGYYLAGSGRPSPAPAVAAPPVRIPAERVLLDQVKRQPRPAVEDPDPDPALIPGPKTESELLLEQYLRYIALCDEGRFGVKITSPVWWWFMDIQGEVYLDLIGRVNADRQLKVPPSSFKPFRDDGTVPPSSAKPWDKGPVPRPAPKPAPEPSSPVDRYFGRKLAELDAFLNHVDRQTTRQVRAASDAVKGWQAD